MKKIEKERVYPERLTEYTPDKVRRMIRSFRVVIFGHSKSTDCKKAFEILTETGPPVLLINVDEDIEGEYMLDFLAQLTGYRCVPRIFLDGECIGALGKLRKLRRKGFLRKKLGTIIRIKKEEGL